MSPDATGSSESVNAAYLRLTTVGDLTDPVLVEGLLRPWLQQRAAVATHDATMAVLTAQQVIVDFGLSSPADFPSAWAMEQWLDVRLAQTAALFVGAPPPLAGGELAASPGPAASGALLLSPWLARLPKFNPLPWLLGGAATAAVAAGLGAVALTVALTAGGFHPGPGQSPIYPSAGGAQALLPPPSQRPVTSRAPQRSPRSAVGSRPTARGSSSSGTSTHAQTAAFQPVVIAMAPLGSTAVGSAPPPPQPSQPPTPSSAAPPPAAVPPEPCIPEVTAAALVVRAPIMELAATTQAVCPVPHPELPLPPLQSPTTEQTHFMARGEPPAGHGIGRGRFHRGRPGAAPSPLGGRRRPAGPPDRRVGPKGRAEGPPARSLGAR
jgi:hypothetical protein